MLYKEDWEITKKRYEAWWEGEMIDRALVQVRSPKAGVHQKLISEPATLEERWTNIDYIIEATRNKFSSTYFGGEAFPCFWPNLGPDLLCALMGGKLQYAETTSWSKPFVKDWSEHSFKFNSGNPYWKLIEAITKAVAENANGDYVIGITDLHPSLDCLSAMRGAEELCIDMVEEPGMIKKKLNEVTGVFKEVYNRLYAIIHPYQPDGSTTTLEVWYPGGKYFIDCCDFIYMISPEMFEEFALPPVEEELDFLDATIFHVDGIGSLRHLDRILELPKLKAIQWVYGDGQPTAKHWIAVMKKIQEAGKSIYTYGPPQDLKVLLEELSPNRLLYDTWTESEEDARDLIKMTKELSYKRKIY